jgi:hypothetical protein
VRHAPFAVETLEPRLLMAGGIPWSILGQLENPPAEVAGSQRVIPVVLHLPGGDATVSAIDVPPGDPDESGVLATGGVDLYRVSVGSGTGTAMFGLDLSYATLPQGDSLHLLVFDEAGDPLVDWSANAPTAVSLVAGGPVSIPSGAFDVAILVAGPSDATSAAGATGIVFQIQVMPESSWSPLPQNATGPTAGVGDVVYINPLASFEVYPTELPGRGTGSSGNAQGNGGQVGPVATGSGSQTGGQHGSSSQGGSSSSAPGFGMQVTSDGRGAPGPSSTSTPIDVGPLPTSPYEPAAGIFSVGAPNQPSDPVETIYVEMSLVRPTSGPPRAPHDDRSPGQGAGIGASVSLDPAEGRSYDVSVTVVSARSNRPGTVRPVRRPPRAAAAWSPEGKDAAAYRLSLDWHDAVLTPEDSDGPPWGGLLASAATLPPIAGNDRPRIIILPTGRRDEAIADEESPRRRVGRAGAIVLGLSASAALGVSLYAPDLTAAIRRASRSPATKPRARAATRGRSRIR